MKLFTKSIWAAALAGALAIGGLAGCQFGPSTTAEVLEGYAKAGNADNYHATELVTFSADADSVMNIASDIEVATDASHTRSTGSVVGNEFATETYVEKEGDHFAKYESVDIAGTTVWTKSNTDKVADIQSITSAEILTDAEFAKTDTGYTLSVPAQKMVEVLAGSSELLEGINNADSAEFKKALEESKAVYTFDKDCQLTNIDLAVTIAADDSAEADATAADAATTDEAATDAAATDTAATDETATTEAKSATFGLTCTFSDRGAIEAATLAVPADVKENVIDLEQVKERLNQLGAMIGNVVDGITDMASNIDLESLNLNNIDLEGIANLFTVEQAPAEGDAASDTAADTGIETVEETATDTAAA